MTADARPAGPRLALRPQQQAWSGPQHTPPSSALRFTPEFGAADYAAAVRESNHAAKPAPLSLYLHVPFCASGGFHRSRHTEIAHDRASISAYVRHLQSETFLQAALFDRTREVRQIHFGGGTPSLLSFGDFGNLLWSLESEFTLVDGGRLECSLEVDPRQASAADVFSWRRLGFNRLFLGVADLDPELQHTAHRAPYADRIADLTEAARQAGFHSVTALSGDPLAPAPADGSLQRACQGHTPHAACDLIGFGANAVSRIGDCYAENSPDLSHYTESIRHGRLAIVRGYRTMSGAGRRESGLLPDGAGAIERRIFAVPAAAAT